MAKKRKNDKAVIYARFSPRTHESECESVERQLEFCEKYCEFYGLEIIGRHYDKAKSGRTQSGRPGLQKALDKAIKHKATLVVYSMSRLARNLYDLIQISERLNKANAGLCSTKEKIDTTTAQGDLFFKIIGLIDEFIRKSNAETTSRMMRQHQSTGRIMSRWLPYGWQPDPKDPKRMIPNDYEQKVIDRVMELHNKGMGTRAICRVLQEEGYEPRPKKRKFGKRKRTVTVKGNWNHVTLKRVIEREQSSAD